MLSLILFILILGAIILVHEFGHFIFAKMSNIYVYEFSIGMGPKIFSYKKKGGETEYCIRLIPLGGFVSLAGENGENEKKLKDDRKMYNKSFIQRFLVLFAGAGFNFIFAFILLFISALFFGSVSTKPIIGNVMEGYPAYDSGLQEGDFVLKANGEKVKNWDALLWEAQTSNGNDLVLEVKHENGDIETITISPMEVTDKEGKISYVFGIAGNTEKEYGLLSSISYAVSKTGALFNLMFETIKSLFTGLVSVNDLSGPVGIYSVVDSQSKNGMESILYLVAFLSINVGVINLLPFLCMG